MVDAAQAGEVAESVIDEHLRRLLRLADRVGALGEMRDYPDQLPLPDSRERREQLTRLAADGITVLSNLDQTLPLDRSSRLALIGRHAVQTIGMGGGSAQVNPPYQVSVAQGLTALLGDNVTVTDGVEVRGRAAPANKTFVSDPETGLPGIRALLYAADGSLLEERHQSTAVVLTGFEDDVPEPVERVVIRAQVVHPGQIEVGVLGVGDWVLRNGQQTA